MLCWSAPSTKLNQADVNLDIRQRHLPESNRIFGLYEKKWTFDLIRLARYDKSTTGTAKS